MALINIVDERIGLISQGPANTTQAVSITTSIVPQASVSTNRVDTGITQSPVNISSTPESGGGGFGDGVTFKYERHYPPGREGCPGGIVVDTIIGNPDDTNPAEPGETTIHQFIDCPPKTATGGGFYDGSRETGFFWTDPYDPGNPNRPSGGRGYYDPPKHDEVDDSWGPFHEYYLQQLHFDDKCGDPGTVYDENKCCFTAAQKKDIVRTFIRLIGYPLIQQLADKYPELWECLEQKFITSTFKCIKKGPRAGGKEPIYSKGMENWLTPMRQDLKEEASIIMADNQIRVDFDLAAVLLAKCLSRGIYTNEVLYNAALLLGHTPPLWPDTCAKLIEILKSGRDQYAPGVSLEDYYRDTCIKKKSKYYGARILMQGFLALNMCNGDLLFRNMETYEVDENLPLGKAKGISKGLAGCLVNGRFRSEISTSPDVQHESIGLAIGYGGANLFFND